MKSVIICDMEGVIQKMNKGAAEMFGYDPKELIGIKRVSLFSPGEIVLQNVLGWLEKADKDGENNIKTNFIRKDGSIFGAEITITPNFANGKDKPQTGYCGITKELEDRVNIPIKFTTKIIKGIAITRGGFTLASILPMMIVAYILSFYNILNLLNAFISILGVICLHIFSNLYNDFFDVSYGSDEENKEYFNVGSKSLILRGAQISGGSRAIELGLTTLKKTSSLGNIMLFLSIICLLILSFNSYIITGSSSNVFMMSLIAASGVFLGFFYTAKPLRLSARKGLGELTIFLAFGPLLTLGSMFSMSNISIDLNSSIIQTIFFIGIPLGLLTTNILFINQFPDYESDKKTGKTNLVVIFGKKISRWIYLISNALIFVTLISFIKIMPSEFPFFNKPLFYVGIFCLLVYALYISVGLIKKYNSRDLVFYNIQTIYFQIIFCVVLIISFYL
jgi:1,4-dihydroxy-2-naphthoate octaprenyltransferase